METVNGYIKMSLVLVRYEYDAEWIYISVILPFCMPNKENSTRMFKKSTALTYKYKCISASMNNLKLADHTFMLLDEISLQKFFSITSP